MPPSSQHEIGLTESHSGIAWPKQYKSLLPVIRKEWEVADEIYLNRRLGGGLSGAMVFVADVTCRGFEGQAILKLDTVESSDWSEDKEFESHRTALETSPEYAAKHLPRLLHATQDGDQIAILSTIAGRGLEYAVPWYDCPFTQQTEFARRVSGGILERWNIGYEVAKGFLEPQVLLESWVGYRLDPEQGRLLEFLSECGLGPDEPCFTFQGEWFPNPYAFAKRILPLPERTHLRAVRGQTHGDLHGNNLLIASPPRSEPQYYLIDLELYRRNAFLFFDHAYFELNYLLHAREDVDAGRWKSIIDNLSRFHAHSEKSGPEGDDLGLYKIVEVIRQTWLTWVDRQEPNRLSNMENQYFLARIAVGLICANRRTTLHARCMGFTYAASNLKDYLRLNGIDWPKHGPVIAFPTETADPSPPANRLSEPTSGVAAAAKANGSSHPAARRWSTAAALLLLLLAAGGIVWWQPWVTQTVTTASDPTIQLPDVERPSIAVLPFENLSEGSQGAMLARGMEEALISSLDKVPRLFVISSHSVAAFREQNSNLADLGRTLKVRYLLEGSVQEIGGDIRVVAKLIEVATGQVVWSHRYDRQAKDFFAIQDEIALRVLVALQVQLTEGLQAELTADYTDNVDAYLLYANGLEAYRKFTRQAMVEVRRLMDEALKLDPKFAPALVLKARSHVADVRLGHTDSAEDSLEAAAQTLRQVAELPGEISDTQRAAILIVDAYIDLIARRYDDALAAGGKAVSMAPNNAEWAARFGSILFFSGDYDRSIRMMRRAIRLSPFYPSWYALYLSRAYAFKGNHGEAIKWGKDALARSDSDGLRSIMNVNLAFAYQEAGDAEKAKLAASHALQEDPDFSLNTYATVVPFKNDRDWQRYSSALRAAGIPG